MVVVGYAQGLDEGPESQRPAGSLKAAGAHTIFREKVSAVRADRPQLAKLMAGQAQVTL